MEPYRHIVQYYETDRMGVTHHSNYVRWMEEARVDFLRQIGWPYEKLEEMGIVSPVIEVSCKYKNSTTFSNVVYIPVSVKEFKGVKLFIHYEMVNDAGAVVATADSVHCFLDRDGKPVRVSKQYPDFSKALTELAANE